MQIRVYTICTSHLTMVLVLYVFGSSSAEIISPITPLVGWNVAFQAAHKAQLYVFTCQHCISWTHKHLIENATFLSCIKIQLRNNYEMAQTCNDCTTCPLMVCGHSSDQVCEVCNDDFVRLVSPEFTSEPEALPQRPDRQACDGEAEVGHGVQGLPGVCGRIHEHAGESITGDIGMALKTSQSYFYFDLITYS